MMRTWHRTRGRRRSVRCCTFTGWLTASALLVGGCAGSAPSPSASTPSPPTKAQYIRRADALCARAATSQRLLRVPQLSGTPAQVLVGLGRYVGQLLPIARRSAIELRAMAQPTRDRSELNRYLAAVDGAVAALERLGAAARRGDAAAVRTGSVALSGNTANRLARRYGFRVCGGSAPAAGG